MSDARTRQYTGGLVATRPVGIVANDSVHLAAGRVAVLAAVNAVVRNHPIVYLCATDVVDAAGVGVHEAVSYLGTATPTSRLEIVESLPVDVPSIGVGPDVDADIYVAANRFVGAASGERGAIAEDPSSTYGAGIGAMLASSRLFRRDLGLADREMEPISLWTMDPADPADGPPDAGPIDIGSGWVIGAGGVGSSFAWWLRTLGNTSSWTFIDHDRVDSTNLNRSLGLFAHHLDRGDGTPWFKADAAAELLTGSVSFPDTWREWARTDPPSRDVLIPAANEFGVRRALAKYGHPFALTGTTSLDWTAELHLYRSGVDGCIDCRHPEESDATLACSTSPVPTVEGGSTDAALSFLSGTAGLLTAAALAKLQTGSVFGGANHWTIRFQPSRAAIEADRYTCSGGVPHAPDHRVLASQFGRTRWYGRH